MKFDIASAKNYQESGSFKGHLDRADSQIYFLRLYMLLIILEGLLKP